MTVKVLPFPRPRLSRSRARSRQVAGLVNIAEACATTPDKLVDWWLHHGFPMTYRGWKWVTTWQKIERWLKARLQAERDARRHAGTSTAS